MRRWLCGVGLLAVGAVAQEAPGNLFSTLRPDVILVVREHPTSAEIVQVTVLAKGYPPELLKSQVDKMASILGSTVRGLRMTRPNLGTEAEVSFLRGEFATDGLIDRTKGIVRLAPIAKAFAGAPEPYTVKGIKVAFEGERTTKKMIKNYPVEGVVRVEGRASAQPPGIEYQIQLLTQDPALIDIPEEYAQPANQKPVEKPSSSPNGALLIGLFLLAGLALGALVYLALLRGGARRTS